METPCFANPPSVAPTGLGLRAPSREILALRLRPRECTWSHTPRGIRGPGASS